MFTSDFFSMSKETHQEPKRISKDELRELLSDLDNVFDLGQVSYLAQII
tara:strand:- start:176 stop:322 length:147 start_codon:yes stop_codon:yes gene_type:complete